MRSELEVATNFVITILSRNVNIDSANELFKIRSGNKEVLKEHMKAIRDILNKAISELEGKDKE